MAVIAGLDPAISIPLARRFQLNQDDRYIAYLVAAQAEAARDVFEREPAEKAGR